MLAVRSKHLVAGLFLVMVPLLSGFSLAPGVARASSPPRGIPVSEASRPALLIVSKERIQTHSQSDPLDQFCRTDHHVYACTEPRIGGFHGRCERFPDGWGVVAEIELDFVIHLADPLLFSHERLHIRDIESALPRRLEPLLAARFDTPDGCAKIAAVISAPAYAFAVLNEVATASNQSRGCSAKGKVKPKIARGRRRP